MKTRLRSFVCWDNPLADAPLDTAGAGCDGIDLWVGIPQESPKPAAKMISSSFRAQPVGG
jgi:hypothetical protein